MVLYQYAIDRWVKPVIDRNYEAGRAAGFVVGMEKGMVMGRREGRKKANREWRAWLARKADAESRGLPFDEPMPDEKAD